MIFRGGNYNRITRLFAGLVVMAMAAPLVLFRNPIIWLVGASICGIGLGAVVWQGFRMWREREDPYDLNRLWDTPPAEPETPTHTAEGADLIYCPRCGTSRTQAYANCPECGSCGS